jgi:glycosyltransferase involved in cell wall biosynthesis
LRAGYFERTSIREVLYNFGNRTPVPLESKDYGGDRPLRLGFIGFLSENKGIRWLLQTLRDAAIPRVELVVAGRGQEEYERSLREEFAGPTTKFVGFTKPADLFEAVDITVVPSLWHDTLPSVVFESLGHGVPVLGARRGGIPEMVIDGVNGLLFEPDQRQTFLDAVEQLRNNPSLIRGLRSACIPSAKKFYDVAGWVEREEAIFERTRRVASRLDGAVV